MLDERIDVFKSFANWLYSGKLVDEDDREDVPLGNTMLARLYFFPDKHEVFPLGNAIIDIFMAKFIRKSSIPIRILPNIYDDEHLPHSDPLRRLLVLMFAGSDYCADVSNLQRHSELFPQMFLFEVMAIMKNRPERVSAVRQYLGSNQCEFHKHNINDWENCSATLAAVDIMSTGNESRSTASPDW